MPLNNSINTPLPFSVASGGTGTSTAFTAGSVVFAGASGVYTQDNANLFWDDTNNRLGIGTNTPTYNLEVAGTGSVNASVRSTTGPVVFDILSGAAAGTTNAYLRFVTSTTSWRVGIPVADFSFHIQSGGTDCLTISNLFDVNISSGNLAFGTQGKGLQIRIGAAASRMGVVTLTGLTTTVANTSVTANTYIFLSRRTATGTIGNLRIGTVTPGTSFQILSVAGDTSQVYWLMIESAP